MKKFILLFCLLLPFTLCVNAETSSPTSDDIQESKPVTFLQEENGKPNVYVFTSPTCGHCLRFKQEFYPKLKKEFQNKVNFVDINTADGEGGLKLMNMAEQYEIDRPGVPCIVAGETCLIGYPGEIKEFAESAIKDMVKKNAQTKTLNEVDARTAFNNFTFAAIIINGLIDGINPCAFAVIVFLVSFLTIYRYDKKEVILIGSSYCLAVFIAYILIGLGLFNAIYALSAFQTFINIFYIVTAAACVILFILSVYDFIIYLKTKNSKEMLLTLSNNLKIRINKIIGFFLRGKKHSTLGLIFASLAVGFSVSLVEAVCTGQVYIPTIVLIMKDPALRVQAWLYLLLYNVMFILPLLCVFILCAIGIKSEGINNFFKKHLAIAKLFLSLVFLGLAIMLLMNIHF